MTHRELGIVGDGRADADDNRIDQRTQLMQMIEPRRAVDIARMPRQRGNAPVERGGQLQHDERPARATVVQVGGELVQHGLVADAVARVRAMTMTPLVPRSRR